MKQRLRESVEWPLKHPEVSQPLVELEKEGGREGEGEKEGERERRRERGRGGGKERGRGGG